MFLLEIALAASVLGNIVLGVLSRRPEHIVTVEVVKEVEVEVEVGVCCECDIQHRVEGTNWHKRTFEANGPEAGWSRNWVKEEQ